MYFDSNPVKSKKEFDESIQLMQDESETAVGSKEYYQLSHLQLIDFGSEIGIVRTKVLDEFIRNNGSKNAHRCPRMAHMDNVFECIWECHERIGHGKVKKTWSEVNLHFSNISRSMIELFVKLCPGCIPQKDCFTRKVPLQPIYSDTFNDRGQMDLIDMQATKDGCFRFILHYQDHLIKFSFLRALRRKST